MGWLRLVGSLKLQVSFAKEPYQRDYTLQKRPIILRSLLIVATPYDMIMNSFGSLLVHVMMCKLKEQHATREKIVQMNEIDRVKTWKRGGKGRRTEDTREEGGRAKR